MMQLFTTLMLILYDHKILGKEFRQRPECLNVASQQDDLIYQINTTNETTYYTYYYSRLNRK